MQLSRKRLWHHGTLLCACPPLSQPDNIVNYLADVTAIFFRDCAVSTIFIIPGTAFYIFLGASAGLLLLCDWWIAPECASFIVVNGLIN
jgi:uncharacterized membrane protein YdjX (TVP38/TMEM64 family)